jgi:hypothetical protein
VQNAVKRCGKNSIVFRYAQLFLDPIAGFLGLTRFFANAKSGFSGFFSTKPRETSWKNLVKLRGKTS